MIPIKRRKNATGSSTRARPRTIPVQRGDRSKIALDVPTRAQARRTSEPVADPGRTRRLIGLGASGAGVLAVGIAGIATLRARSDYDHALHGYCNDAPDMCDPTGLSRTHSARHRANIATAVTLLGTAAVGGAHRGKEQVVLHLGHAVNTLWKAVTLDVRLAVALG